jgi:hypothetical protein
LMTLYSGWGYMHRAARLIEDEPTPAQA